MATLNLEPIEDGSVVATDPKPKKKVVKLDLEPIVEPVKKKESTLPSGNGLSKPSKLDLEPIVPSSEKGQVLLTNKQIGEISSIKLLRTQDRPVYDPNKAVEKLAEKSAKEFVTGEKDSGSFEESLAKGTIGLVKDIIPASFLSARSAGVRTKPYTKEDLNDWHAINDASNVLFRQKINNGDYLGALSIGDEEAKKYIEEQIKKPEQYQKEQIQEKIRLFNEAKVQQQEFNDYTGNVVKSVSDINNPSDVASYVAYNVGQSIPQMGMALLTGGMSGYVQERAEIYDQQVQKIASDKGITEDDVIKQGLDNPEAGQGAAVLAGALDRIGVEAILKNFGKDAFVNMIKSGSKYEVAKQIGKSALSGAVTEGTTEGAQYIVEETGSSLAAGRTATKSATDVSGRQLIESMVAGATSGAILGGVSELTHTNTSQDVAHDASINVNPENVEQVTASAETIQAKIEEDSSVQTINQQQNAKTISENQGGIPQEGEASEGSQNNSSQNLQQPEGQEPGNGKVEQQEGLNSEEQKLSGIKKALVSEEKVGATEIERRSTEQMLMKSKEQVDSGEIDPKAIVEEIANGKARALQPDEVSGLVYYKTQLDNKSDQLNASLVKAIQNGDTEQEQVLRSQLSTLQSDVDKYETMSIKTAYEQSLAFRLRQMLVNNEYNLETQINKYKAANNGIISKNTEDRFRQLDAQLKEANLKIQEYETQKNTKASEESLLAIRQSLEKERIKRKKLITEEKKVQINNFFDSIKVKNVEGTANDITRVLGSAIWNGSVETMKQAILAGANVANAVQAGIDYVREHYRGNDFVEEDFRKHVQPGIENSIPSAKEKITGLPEVKNGKLKVPESAIHAVVEGGANTIEEVTSKIHGLIKNEFPEITEREVRDAITKYGQTRNMSQEDINKKIREIKRAGKAISQLEDIQNKKRPLRSGLQRDKLTDAERKVQRDIREKLKDLPMDDEEIGKAWKNALDTVKSRLKNQILDLEKQLETGEKSEKKKDIRYDEEASLLKEQRDKLKQAVIELEGKPKMSDEQKVRMAISTVERSISDFERRIKENDFSRRGKSENPVTSELKALREKRDQVKKTFLELEKAAGVAEQRKLGVYKNTVKKSIQGYEDRIKNQDFITPKKEAIKKDDEAKKLLFERDLVKQKFQIEQEKARLANRSLNEKLWDTTVDTINLPKSLLASIDMSAPFRQGLVLSAGHPILAGKATAEMFKHAFSERKSQMWLHELKQTPAYMLMKDSKLYIAEPNTKLTAKEEQFLSNFASKIPIFGRLVKGSERAYTAYLNKIRTDVFINGTDRMAESGITFDSNPEAYKAWANFVNNASGRGNLGALEDASTVLNGFMFSPRFLASRVNLLNPVTYAKMPKPVRIMAMKNMAAYIGFVALTLALAKAAGADVELDPRSSDFLKIKIGDTRYDILAGFQQVIRFFAQFLTGEKKQNGKIKKVERLNVLGQFVRSKLSPAAGTAVNLITGKDMIGNEVTPLSELYKNTVPLYIQDVSSLYDSENPTGVLTTAVPAFFGVGVQDYDAYHKKKH